MQPAYVFDAYGTLFDVHSAVARLREEVGPNADRLSEIWRIKQLQYTWVRSMSNRYQPFRKLTGDGLDFAIAAVGGIADGVRQKLLDAYMTLDAYPEVVPVLGALKARGATLAILTNGSPDMIDAAVQSAGLSDILDGWYSVDEIGIYKPDPRVYQITLDKLNLQAGQVSFYSSNRWDVAGATAFGYHANWVNRTHEPDEFSDLPPEKILNDLNDISKD